MSGVIETMRELMTRGGPVMWPLAGLSVLTVALVLERALFWVGVHRGGRGRWVAEVTDRLRAGDDAAVRAMASRDSSVYGDVVRAALTLPASESVAIELVERFRRRVERFSTALSTAITAGPLLGILGTVTGIIQSFDLLGRTRHIADIEPVAAGIAEALITTAFGLVIALVALFPYMAFRAQADRFIGAVEVLAAARCAGGKGKA